MKKRILSIILMFSMIVSVLPVFSIVSSAEDISLNSDVPVATVGHKEYYSIVEAWVAAVKERDILTLLTDWNAPNRDFSTGASGSQKDYFFAGSLYIPKEKSVTLDLNGHSISRGLYGHSPIANGQVMYLARDAQLYLEDSSNGRGKIEDGSSTDGAGGIHAGPGSRIYMLGGSIEYCYSDWHGGAVYLDSGAMMYMYDGCTMRYNRAKKDGGAVYADRDSRFYMYGGEIYGNKAEWTYKGYSRKHLNYGGGAIFDYKAYVWLEKGIIRNNESYVGSAIDVEQGDIYLMGTEIVGNTGVELGGLEKGAAIVLGNIDTCYIKNTSIHSNHGGGIVMESGSDTNFQLGGEVKIYDNLTDDGTARDLELGYKQGDPKVSLIYLDDDFKDTSRIGITLDDKDYASVYTMDLGGSICKQADSGKYVKCFFANEDDYRIVPTEKDNKLSVETNKTGQDAFIEKVLSVTDVYSRPVEIKSSYIKKSTRDVYITVPFGTDIRWLTVNFQTTGDSSILPFGSFNYADFTNPVGIQLENRNDTKGRKMLQNWTIHLHADNTNVFDVNVTNGKMSDGKTTGEQQYTRSVTVTADEIENKRFVRWETEGIKLENAEQPSVTFTMPKNNVNLTAVYEDLQSLVEMKITPPSAGCSLDEYATITLKDGSTTEVPINWAYKPMAAMVGMTYTAVVSLSDEYGFANNIKATVNGNDAEIKRINDYNIAITYRFTVKDKLTQVYAEPLYFAHADSADEFKLPETVWISTQAGTAHSAKVTWNRDDFWRYIPESGNSQAFNIRGTVTLPYYVDPNGIPLETTVTIYVGEAESVGMVNMSLQKNGVYTENQELVLSTQTEGAEIYYWMTDDGSTPAEPIPPAGHKYTGPIQLTGKTGERVTYKIRAVAAKSGMKTSGFNTHTFYIDIPVDPRPLYDVKVVDKDGNTVGLGGGSYHAGDVVTVKTIGTSDKYIFKDWKVTSGNLTLTDEQKNSQTFTFVMPEENVTITGEFIDTITKIKLKLNAPSAGQPLSTSAGYEIYNDKSSTPVKSGDSGITPVWDPSDTKAMYFSSYRAVCTLKPNTAEDIIFADSVTAEVDGAEGVSCQKNSDGSVTVYTSFKPTAKAKIKSIPAPPEVYKAYGDEYDVADVLPKTVPIVTDDENTKTAEVIWDTASYIEPTFSDPEDDGREFRDATVNGEIILPENAELGTDEYGITISKRVEITVCVSNPYHSELPSADLKPGIYNENKTVTLSVSDGSTIYYKINDGEEQTYTAPIPLNGKSGQSVKTTIQAYTKNTADPYMSSGKAEYTYTIELPARNETVTVINGTGSGEYTVGQVVNIMAEPTSGMVFKKWKAESVYYTTQQKEETIKDADGNNKTITVDVTTRHADVLSDVIADESKGITTLTVPELADGRTLEVTAECDKAVMAVNLRATLPKGGEKLPTEITTDSDGVSIVPKSFKITPDDDKAKYDKIYTMSVDVTANDGYTFGENTVFNINGGVADANKNDDGSYTITYIYKTGKDSVVSVKPADELKNLSNGMSMGDIIGLLPNTLTVTTDGGTAVDVPVIWESNPIEGSYNPESDVAQTFKLRAILQLPEDISNPDELYGEVQINVDGEKPYSVKVNGGSGSGNYKKGSVVPISLTNVPNDKVFTHWNVDEGDVTLNNSNAKSTFFTMPSENVVISAAYKDKIKNVELTIDEPIAGRTLPTEVTCQTEGVDALLAWSPNDTDADYNKEYTAGIRLKADSANFYEFADKVNVSVNGNDVDVVVNEDKTITVTYDFTTAKAKLTEILPSKLTGVKNGTALADMPLPERVNVVTEDADITSAKVKWDTSSVDYDSTKTEEQSFTLRGTIKSDDIDISEYDGFPTLNVTVSAADKAAAPIANPIEGTYTENQTVTLTTATEDAKILYSIDNAEFTEYTEPIAVNGTSGETVTTVIKAKTVKDGFADSEVAEYTYTIKLPEPTYTLTVTNGSGSGEYKAGEEVTIMADAAKENTTFAGWEVSDGTVLEAKEQVTFTMPSYPVTVTAKYKDKIKELNLTITEPKTGETFDDTISYGDITGISDAFMLWVTEDTKAQYGVEYTMIAGVIPDSDKFYEFADNTTVTINGKTVYSEKTADGNLIIHASYIVKEPKPTPTIKPTTEPTTEPTTTPTAVPTKKPSSGGGGSSSKRTPAPTVTPTATPTATPTVEPTSTPKAESGNLPFTDIKKSDWFYDDVSKVYKNGLMYGVTDDMFAPNTNITRGMFVAVLYRIDGEPKAEKQHSFKDVSQNDYYADAVAWASQNGIVAGYSDEEYMPNETISREQMAAIMYRYVKYKGIDTDETENTNILSYDDFGEISEYAVSAMQWSAGSSVMVGRSDETLNPLETTTRAEAAAVFNRIIEYLK